jgi:hypothetical protein
MKGVVCLVLVSGFAELSEGTMPQQLRAAVQACVTACLAVVKGEVSTCSWWLAMFCHMESEVLAECQALHTFIAARKSGKERCERSLVMTLGGRSEIADMVTYVDACMVWQCEGRRTTHGGPY